MFDGHVGDSRIILGRQVVGENSLKSNSLTTIHRPDNPDEVERIHGCGGEIGVSDGGTARVIYKRFKYLGHSAIIENIPFQSVSRSISDFWSYNSDTNKFVISPEPEVSVFEIDATIDKCIILATDGLWDVVSPQTAVHIVETHENEESQYKDGNDVVPLNASNLLVVEALRMYKTPADIISITTVMLDREGPAENN